MAGHARHGTTIAWIAGPSTYLTLEAIAAAAFPHYSYTDNFISDLGVPAASARAALMNTAFCVQGTLFLAGAVFLSRGRLFLALAAANAVGNVLVAEFHSGVFLHAVGAVLAIVGGNAAILAAPRRHRWLGVFGLLSFVVFVVTMHDGPRGLWERGSVYSILAWQLSTAIGLLWSRLDS